MVARPTTSQREEKRLGYWFWSDALVRAVVPPYSYFERALYAFL